MEVKRPNNVIKKKASERRDVLVLLLSLVVSCAFIYLVVKPLYEEKISLEGDVIKRQNDLKNKQSLLSNIEDFNKKNRSLVVDAQKLKVFVSKTNNYEEVMDYLNGLASQQNLIINGYEITVEEYGSDGNSGTGSAPAAEDGTAASTEPVERLKTQTVSIEIKGGYDSFISFMKEVENGVPFLQESALEIVAPKRDEAAGDEQAEIDNNPTLTFMVDLDFVYY